MRKARAKLTLVFDLQTSGPRPVRVRLASFRADRTLSGGLEKWVYPPAAGSFYRHSVDLAEMSEREGKFDPAAPFIQLSWEMGSDAPQPWPKADGHLIRVDNVVVAAPSFYVSAAGSDKADGRSEATAFPSCPSSSLGTRLSAKLRFVRQPAETTGDPAAALDEAGASRTGCVSKLELWHEDEPCAPRLGAPPDCTTPRSRH